MRCRVDQRYQRQAETVGHLHYARRLAIALGAGAAEIVLDTRLGVVALLLTDDGDGRAVKAGKPRLDRVVIGEIPVAGKRR